MTKKRLERWESAKYLMTMLSGRSNNNDALTQEIENIQGQTGETELSLNLVELIEACRELIYDEDKGAPVFHAILHSFDVKKGKIRVEHALDILIGAEEDDDEEAIEDEIISTLAIAVASDVPVYPNTEKLTPILTRFHHRLLIDGFTMPGEGGERVRLKLTKFPGESVNSMSFLRNIDLTETYSPADLKLFQEAIFKELERLESANSVLMSLSYSA